MSIITRAHIKNDKNKQIKITVYGSVTGAIIREKIMNVPPTRENLPQAVSWLKGEYKHVEHTDEGFDGRPPPLTTNEEGQIVQEGTTVADADTAAAGVPVPVADLELPVIDVNEGAVEIPVSSQTTPLSPSFVPSPPIFDNMTPQQQSEALRAYSSRLANMGLFAGRPGDLGPIRRDARDQQGRERAEDLSEEELRKRINQTINIRGEEFSLHQINERRLEQAEHQGEMELTLEDIEEGGVGPGGGTVPDDMELSLEDIEGGAPRPAPSAMLKRAVQVDGLSKKSLRSVNNLSEEDAINNRGIGGDHIVEPVPNFDKARTEHVISNRYNSWIVLGRDRADPEDATRASGYGGKGNTQCGSIDLVTGRMSPSPREVDFKDQSIYVDPIFNIKTSQFGRVCDAARIYLSQKTDVDVNFKLAKGKVGTAEARSAVAIKADGVRIMAREGIKLVTGADPMNSQGGNRTTITGVDIIAGNDDEDLQPMVLGHNLVDALTNLEKIVSDVVGSLQSVINDVALLNLQMITHFHISPFFGAPTTPSPSAMPTSLASLFKLVSVDSFSTSAEKWNLVRFKTRYLLPGSPMGIKSKYNNVN